jgi:hypothetical protein
MNIAIRSEYNLLIIRKNELGKQLAELGVSGKGKNAKAHFDKEKWDKRMILAKEYSEIESNIVKLKALNGKSVNFDGERIRDIDIAKSMIKEFFGEEYRRRFFAEYGRRRDGEPPLAVHFEAKKDGVEKNYKKELQEAYDLLIAARKSINSYIDQNEPEINKAYYFQSVSKLSKCLPSVQEIEKLNRTLNYIKK